MSGCCCFPHPSLSGRGRVDGPTLCCTHSLDQLLDSGLYTGEVTELMGAPGSGKTQVSGMEERKVVVGGTWCLQACPAPNREPLDFSKRGDFLRSLAVSVALRPRPSEGFCHWQSLLLSFFLGCEEK